MCTTRHSWYWQRVGSLQIRLHVQMDDSYIHMFNWEESSRESLDFTLEFDRDTFEIRGYRWVMKNDREKHPDNPCLTYEEVATDFQVGVEIDLPKEIQAD